MGLTCQGSFLPRAGSIILYSSKPVQHWSLTVKYQMENVNLILWNPSSTWPVPRSRFYFSVCEAEFSEMKNDESNPQNHETSIQYDEGCIFLFLREQVLLCGLVCLISETPLSVCGLWVELSALSSPTLSPQLCCRVRQGNPKWSQRQWAVPGEWMLSQHSAQVAPVSTAFHSAPAQISISTQDISCCLKRKRMRIRRTKVQYSLQALSFMLPGCWIFDPHLQVSTER